MKNSSQRLSLISISIVALALCCILFADIQIYSVEPWHELNRMLIGLFSPDLSILDYAFPALGQTVAFALIATAGSALLGLLLSLFFHSWLIRVVCASSRAVHELFWGLIFMQVFGLSAVTGILAILIPFTGTFAKVFSEIFEQQSAEPARTVSVKTGKLSLYCYTLLPQALPEILSYIRYRFECALRSSTILGFIGLPTLGFYLETAFKQGHYGESATLLLLFFGLIASIKIWFHRRLAVIYLVLSILLLPKTPTVDASLWSFLSHDIWPSALLAGDWWNAYGWYKTQLISVALPAIKDTLLLSQIALAGSALVALISYGLASKKLSKYGSYRIGQGLLLVMRSTPEMILAFIFLLLFGPSFLPAIFALSIHNGGLIGFLIAEKCNQLRLRLDAPKSLNLYFYELTPKIYGHFLTLLLYRWEVIVRETAILGILGVTTLGFYIDSAFEDIRYDRAAFLIVMTALLNIFIDSLARKIRSYGQLNNLVTR
jgi:phosphonate transport system permease protein